MAVKTKNKMERENLRIEKFTNPEKSFVTERYVVENEKELALLLVEFPQLNGNFMKVEENWRKALKEGRILLITDEHSMSGFPTYCFESPKDSTHPNSLIRI